MAVRSKEQPAEPAVEKKRRRKPAQSEAADTSAVKKRRKKVSDSKKRVSDSDAMDLVPADSELSRYEPIDSDDDYKPKENFPVLHKKGVPLSDNDFHAILNQSMSDVYHLLEVNDTDNAIQLLYKRVIQSSYKMLAQIEASMQEGGGTRGAYPFNAVATTLRDYLTDLQASMDRGHLAETILDNILRPMFLEMASSIVIELGNISKEAKLSMSESKFEDFHNNVVRISQDKIIQTMQRSYEKAKDEARKALQR